MSVSSTGKSCNYVDKEMVVFVVRQKSMNIIHFKHYLHHPFNLKKYILI